MFWSFSLRRKCSVHFPAVPTQRTVDVSDRQCAMRREQTTQAAGRPLCGSNEPMAPGNPKGFVQDRATLRSLSQTLEKRAGPVSLTPPPQVTDTMGYMGRARGGVGLCLMARLRNQNQGWSKQEKGGRWPAPGWISSPPFPRGPMGRECVAPEYEQLIRHESTNDFRT